MSLPAIEPRRHGVIASEVCRLLAAVQYFTRLPLPAWVGHNKDPLDDAAGYLPVVGLLVGVLGAGVLAIAYRLWTVPVAVVLSMMTTISLTGAFHEDGLADAVDGLGGSPDRARALEIMKDSRIGVFGALAVILVLLLKFATLSALPLRTAAWALIAAHIVSRLGAVIIMATLPYVRKTDDSRSKPLVRRLSIFSLLTGCVTAAVVLIPLQLRGIAGAIGAFFVCLSWRWYLRRRLGGYTGDCLGAAQQLSEVMFYIVCAAVW